MFKYKREKEEVTGGWRKQGVDRLHDVHPTANTFGKITSGRTRSWICGTYRTKLL